MQNFEDLIQAYVAAKFDREVVIGWYQEHSPNDEALSSLAECIGEFFLVGRIDFMAANGLLNQLMPLAGFEAAPKRFWQYYVAFEDFETSINPDSDARATIAALGNGVA